MYLLLRPFHKKVAKTLHWGLAILFLWVSPLHHQSINREYLDRGFFMDQYFFIRLGKHCLENSGSHDHPGISHHNSGNLECWLASLRDICSTLEMRSNPKNTAWVWETWVSLRKSQEAMKYSTNEDSRGKNNHKAPIYSFNTLKLTLPLVCIGPNILCLFM